MKRLTSYEWIVIRGKTKYWEFISDQQAKEFLQRKTAETIDKKYKGNITEYFNRGRRDHYKKYHIKEAIKALPEALLKKLKIIKNH